MHVYVCICMYVNTCQTSTHIQIQKEDHNNRYTETSCIVGKKQKEKLLLCMWIANIKKLNRSDFLCQWDGTLDKSTSSTSSRQTIQMVK